MIELDRAKWDALSHEQQAELADSVAALLDVMVDDASKTAFVHVVRHAGVVEQQIVDAWEPDGVRAAKKGEQVAGDGVVWVNRPKKSAHRTNTITTCPDCGRELIAARDLDATRRLLVCPTIHGIQLRHLDALKGSTEDDIVACGRDRAGRPLHG